MSKIVKIRIADLTEYSNMFSLSAIESVESLKQLESTIHFISTERFDWEKNEMVENSFQLSNKTDAIETLTQCMSFRLNMAPLLDNPTCNGAKTNLLDRISATIYHIRH